MPNEVENALTVRGEKADLEKFFSIMRKSQSNFDFTPSSRTPPNMPMQTGGTGNGGSV